MSTFPATFRELVVPDLRRACRLQALSVARERCAFLDAHLAVMAQAHSRGASHLPNQIISDLRDWIDTTILRTIVDIETKPDAAREIVDEVLAWPTI